MTFDLDTWPLTSSTMTQVWLKSIEAYGSYSHFHIFSLSYNLTSDNVCPDPDMWPWSQQMQVPMFYLLPNFGWNPSKQVKVRAKSLPIFTSDNNNRGKSNPYELLCVIPAKAGNTKSSLHTIDTLILSLSQDCLDATNVKLNPYQNLS